MKLKDDIKNLIRRGGMQKSVCRLKRTRRGALIAGTFVAAVATFSSCDMINEDLQPCADKPNVITTVIFNYRYNMERDDDYKYKDLINDHVGSVYLYIFDDNGIYLRRDSLHRIDMGENVDFSLQYDTTILKAGHTYKMVAMAQGNHEGYLSSLKTPGFVLQTEMKPGESKISDYEVKLDRDGDSYADFGIINYKDAYGNNKEMIDTLWSTKPNELQTAVIPEIYYKPQVEPIPDYTNTVEIPLMRITNAINLNLTGDILTEDSKEDDFTLLIYFPHGNGRIDFLGNIIHDEQTQPLFYRSLRKAIIPYTPMSDWLPSRNSAPDYFNSRAGEKYALFGEFGVSRLCAGDDSSLQIRDGHDNSLICEIPNFSDWLVEYFKIEEMMNGIKDPQEFLDRQYEYNLDIEIRDNRIYSWQLGCHILGWGKRHQLLNW